MFFDDSPALFCIIQTQTVELFTHKSACKNKYFIIQHFLLRLEMSEMKNSSFHFVRAVRNKGQYRLPLAYDCTSEASPDDTPRSCLGELY